MSTNRLASSAVDARGLVTGSRSPEARRAMERALWRAMSFYGSPFDDLDAATAADPAWALPHTMRGVFLLSLTEPALNPQAHAALATAARLAGHAPPREQAHLAAARAGAAGDLDGACAAWGEIARAHPRDGFALQWAHLFDFHRGDAEALRHRPAAALADWPRDDPLRPFVLAMQAFGCEENGRYAEAEALGREALAANPQVPWATHAVVHVMEMQGRIDEGLRWLVEHEPAWGGSAGPPAGVDAAQVEGRVDRQSPGANPARRVDETAGRETTPSCPPPTAGSRNGFANHHAWHLALFQLEALDLPAALALHDERLSSAHCAGNLQRLDGASLLWRVQLLGADVGARWHDIATGWDLSPSSAGHSPFNDLHALLVLLGQQRLADAEALIMAVERTGTTLARRLGVPLLRGLQHAAIGHGAEALRTLAPLMATLQRIGGSHAQRDLLRQTLIAAAAQSGERTVARQWLAERCAGRGETPLSAHWRRAIGSPDVAAVAPRAGENGAVRRPARRPAGPSTG